MAEDDDDEQQAGGQTAAQAAMKRIADRELRKIRRQIRRRRALLIAFFLSIAGFAILGIGYSIKSNLDLSRNMIRSPEIRILGYDGALLETIKGHYSQDVSLTTLPERVQNVFVAATDPTFYDHMGVSATDFARIFTSREGTGSTITMKVARSFFKTKDNSAGRHFQEFLVALWLDWSFDKKTILRSYLERTYVGRGIFGITAASRIWYGAPSERMSLHQAAVLAAAMSDPEKYNPLFFPRETAAEANSILAKLGQYKFIEADRVSALTLVMPKLDVQVEENVLSGYVVDMVLEEVADLVGYTSRDIEVVTSIDLKVQNLARDVVKEVAELRLKPRGADQVGLLAISPEGRIRAMIGGADYSPFQRNRVTEVRHPAGRMIKIATYYYALNENSDPAQWVRDNRMAVGGWRPINPDHEYQGQISLREAFVRDVNTVPANLADHYGLLNVRQYAHDIGITSPLSTDIRTVVGLDPVTVSDIAAIHTLPQSSGKPAFITLINSVSYTSENGGQLLYQRVDPVQEKRLTDEAIQGSYVLYSSVTDPQVRLDRPFAGYGTVAGGGTDAWYVGFSSDLITAVWAGNDARERMDVRGEVELASLWRLFMLDAHEGLPIRSMIRASSQRRRTSDGVTDLWKQDLNAQN
ncbi:MULTISPECIES: transglycosylase domain-containing protein [Thalassospira]|uniref:peptidoglycan glycosyltransferase n=2 Tax=Thalassospira TaxID=168934 RepID=A0A367WEZ8_9PROT|nr:MULTISPECIES: transglycosylase domain-containing protein [Thalassospira]MDG4718851.1 transglycosylase domain-containing protein [Thalassospira sp. FZY0004]RCK39819.1 penicillin-binding protein [Thalassospira profundimaris]